jgi:GDP-mannose 6-dehydrogenase
MDQILGSNRRYLELQLPQIYQIIRSSLDEVLNECEGVVLSQDRPEFTEAIHNLKKVPHVLNLTNWQTVVSKSSLLGKVKVSL